MAAGSPLSWIGGGFARMAIAGILIGLFFLIFGMLPWEAFVKMATWLPQWVLNPWSRMGANVVGLLVIVVSLRWNMWSRRQKTVDELAEMLSSAIHDLLNRRIRTDAELDSLDADFQSWCARIKLTLEKHPAYFSKADVIHFDRLGAVSNEGWNIAFGHRHNRLLNVLSLKFDRLRDVMNWTQQRTR